MERNQYLVGDNPLASREVTDGAGEPPRARTPRRATHSGFALWCNGEEILNVEAPGGSDSTTVLFGYGRKPESPANCPTVVLGTPDTHEENFKCHSMLTAKCDSFGKVHFVLQDVFVCPEMDVHAHSSAVFNKKTLLTRLGATPRSAAVRFGDTLVFPGNLRYKLRKSKK